MKVFLDNFENHIACKRMKPYWKDIGVKIVNDVKNSDVQLIRIRTELYTDIPMIQRLDGILYNSKTNYKERNKGIGILHNKASGVIYQSLYSKDAGEYYLKKRTGIYDVIYNGIEKDWCGKYEKLSNTNIVVVSRWRRHKRLKEIIDLFLDYLKKYPNSFLHVIGDLQDNKKINNRNIIYYGQIDHEKMKKIIRIGDFSLHLSKRDACPNSVIEAIGAGMPVITTNACGGATEICKKTDGCSIVDGDKYTIKPAPIYTDKYNVLSKELHHNILMEMFKLTEKKIRVVLPEEFTAENAAKKYYNFMKKVVG
jgi:glycosyltransferase involved in cell wall biosynthesis